MLHIGVENVSLRLLYLLLRGEGLHISGFGDIKQARLWDNALDQAGQHGTWANLNKACSPIDSKMLN